MNKLKYRHEYKHVINLLDYHTLRQRIRLIAKLDRNAGANGRYHIRSLYFDNDNDKALREKLYSLPNREKFRIRIYNESGDFIRLEKKSKVGGLGNKRSVQSQESRPNELGATPLDVRPARFIDEFYVKNLLSAASALKHWLILA